MKHLNPIWLAGLLSISVPALGLELALLADLNGRYGSDEYNQRVSDAVQAVIERRPGLVLVAGDMVAGQKSSLDASDLERMWQSLDRTLTGPLQQAGVPLLITPGNHDGSAMSGFEAERRHFEQHWADREPEALLPGSQWPGRYALIDENVLLISFDGTIPGKLPDAELTFVRAMLAAHSDSVQDVLVMSHLPMWPLAIGRERDIISDTRLLDLLHEYEVDAYISGHHHVFYAGVDSAGMLHLAVGSMGGNTRRFVADGERQPFSMAWLNIQPGGISVAAFAAPDFSEPIDFGSLPESVTGPLGILRRADELDLSIDVDSEEN